MDSKEKVLKTIERLFALSKDNKNENEARNAALFAQRLMAKHGISEEEVMLAQDLAQSDEITTLDSDWSVNSWAWDLLHVVAPNFRCIPLIGTRFKEGKKVKIPVIRGHQTDALLCKKVFQELYLIGETMVGQVVSKDYKARVKTNSTTLSWPNYRDSWIEGYVQGVREAFERQVELYQLMVIIPQDVKDSLRGMRQGSHASFRVHQWSSSAYDNGKQVGKESMTYNRRLDD